MVSVDNLCEVALHKNHNWVAIEAYDATPRRSKCTELTGMEIPAPMHLFAASSFEQETHLPIDGNLINRFDVICRFCLEENKRLMGVFGWSDDEVDIVESLFNIKIEPDDMLPKQICTDCCRLLNQCLAFKQQVALTDTALRRCINQELQHVEIGPKEEAFEASAPGITEQHIFELNSAFKDLKEGQKFEELIEEEVYTPVDEMVCEKNSNLYSKYDEKPVEGPRDSISSAAVKNESIMAPSDTPGYAPHVERSSRKSVKCEQCDKTFSCYSRLQRHIKYHDTKLKYQCRICSRRYLREASLKCHMSSHNSLNDEWKEHKNSFKCEKCNESFAVEHDLYIHGSIHPEDDKIQCRQCGKDFSKLTYLRRHVKTHYEDKPIKCDQCGRGFPEIALLTRHYRIHMKETCDIEHVRRYCEKIDSSSYAQSVNNHTVDKPLECTKCNKAFSDSRCLKQHIRRHSNDKNFTCTVCQKSFADRSKLTSHVSLHTGEKPFVCHVCDKSFRLKWGLMHHLRLHSGEKPYTCSHCPKTFRLPSTLSNHARIHTGEKPFACSHCSKAFGTSSTLADHVRTHTGEKPYKCIHCSKSFGKSSTLAVHVRTHTGEKPYKCPHCSKSFSQSSKLGVHIRTHTGEKPYRCPNCPKSFRLSSTLTVHIRMHTGEKPYKCSHCSKMFGTSSTLADHTRTHTGEKPYKCLHCSKSFRSSSALAIHASMHMDEMSNSCNSEANNSHSTV